MSTTKERHSQERKEWVMENYGLYSSRKPIQCSACLHWERLEEEGASGTPKVAARPGWGTCHLHDLTKVRVKGILETKETFFCSAFVPLAQVREELGVPPRDSPSAPTVPSTKSARSAPNSLSSSCTLPIDVSITEKEGLK